jgi:hypothetical protein
MSAYTFEPRVGQMLPDVIFPVTNGRSTIPMRSDRGETTVVIWRHPFECESCDFYLQSLAGTAHEFRIWEARLVILASPPAVPATPPFAIAVTDNVFVPLQGVGVMAADRYGQVFYVVQSKGGHALPSPRELVEWIKYLGTLCPE